MKPGILMHVDMDAFYASVEQRNNPCLRGKPVIVGGSPNSRGVVATCSYEARRFGVHSAMSSAEAYRRCPQGIFLHADFRAYTHASREVMSLLKRHSPIVHTVSIDEAFLEMDSLCGVCSDAIPIGECIKREIVGELGFTCTVGIGPNRQIAKIASGLQKPDGLTCIAADEIESRIYALPVEKIWGVGPVTSQRLHGYGVETIADLVRLEKSMPTSEVSRLVASLTEETHSSDRYFLKEEPEEHDEKSMSHSQTLAHDVFDPTGVEAMIIYLADKVLMRMLRRNWLARTVGLRLRYANFRNITREITLPEPTDDFDLILAKIKSLLPRKQIRKRGVRLVGVRVAQLSPNLLKPQGELFQEDSSRRRESLAAVIVALRNRFGDKILMRGSSMVTPD